MSLRYYDEILTEKIKRWVPEAAHMRVLKPEETKRLLETAADDTNDAPIRLPFIALSRGTTVDIETNIKTIRSYSGLTISGDSSQVTHLNAIPIVLKYTLDIYTKTMEEGDEYLRSFLFKLINNPKMCIALKYNGVCLEHTAYLRVGESVEDTSAISERLFSGQFTKWTIDLTIYDAFFFNIPYRQTWTLDGLGLDVGKTPTTKEEKAEIEETKAIAIVEGGALEVTSEVEKKWNAEDNPNGSLETGPIIINAKK